MSSLSSVFLLGATGYVGGSLLVSLVKSYPSTTISVLVRSDRDIEAVSLVGPSVRIVKGSHADLELIKAESANAEVIFQVSDPDNLALTQAIVAGLRIRKEKFGKRGILIHTTGSGTIKDEPSGEMTDAYPIWDDTDKDALKTIDINALHRIVDLETIKAHSDGVADVYVICPATIYGVGTGPVRRTSMQIPKLVEIFLKNRRAEYVTKGTNVWSNIHVQDLVRVFHFILNQGLQIQAAGEEKRPTDGFDQFYFATADEHTWGPVVAEIGRAMYKRGLLESPDARSISIETDPILSIYSGSNSRAYSTKLKALGWVPKEKNIIDTVDGDVEFSAKLFAGQM